MMSPSKTRLRMIRIIQCRLVRFHDSWI